MTKKKEKIDWRIVCTGLVCIAGLEVVAITQGFNGDLLRLVLVILALGIGIVTPNPFKTK